jgi:hypothetical protein
MNIVQSGFSTSIKELEEELGHGSSIEPLGELC